MVKLKLLVEFTYIETQRNHENVWMFGGNAIITARLIKVGKGVLKS